jgi:hypothetical protein
MNNEITRYSSPGLEKRERRQSDATVAEVRRSAQRVDGAMALAGHMMGGLTELDKLRQKLAGDDMPLNMMLSDIEAMAIQQCKHIQARLFNPWGL